MKTYTQDRRELLFYFDPHFERTYCDLTAEDLEILMHASRAAFDEILRMRLGDKLDAEVFESAAKLPRFGKPWPADARRKHRINAGFGLSEQEYHEAFGYGK